MRRGALAVAAGAALLSAAAPIDTIPGPDGGWDLVSIDAAHNRLLVGRPDGVMAIDLATHVVTPRFVPGARVHAAQALPDSALGISTNGETNTATLFDAATGAVVATLPTGAGPDVVAVDPRTGLVWVMNHGDGTATLIDPRTRAVVGTVIIGGALEFAAADGAGHLYVNIEDRNEIAVIDTAARKRTGSIALPGCDGPTGLARTAAGVLIVACGNDMALFVDPATGKIVGSVAPGEGADGVIYDPQRGRAFIPAGKSGVLTAIDAAQIGRAREVPVTRLPTAPSARTGAVDVATGKVYLPAARYLPAAAGQRRQQEPGSFAVLVVTP